MKHKKIIILILLVILILALVPIIRNKIFFYQVREKYLSTIYHLKRNGNFHIAYHQASFDKISGESLGQTNTIWAKDGKTVVMYEGDEMNSKSVGLLDGNEAFRINETEDRLSGLVQTRTMYDTDSLISATGVMDEALNGKFKKIEKGEYNGKKCYIAEVDFQPRIRDKIYIDPETYYPLRIESYEGDEYIYEYEWQIIEVGTVTELPQYDLDRIRKNMTLLSEN